MWHRSIIGEGAILDWGGACQDSQYDIRGDICKDRKGCARIIQEACDTHSIIENNGLEECRRGWLLNYFYNLILIHTLLSGSGWVGGLQSFKLVSCWPSCRLCCYYWLVLFELSPLTIRVYPFWMTYPVTVFCTLSVTLEIPSLASS